jgi:hypothetical protein
MKCGACGHPTFGSSLCSDCRKDKSRGICPYCQNDPPAHGCIHCKMPSQADQDMVNAEAMEQMGPW